MRSAILLSALLTLTTTASVSLAMNTDTGHRALGADPECCGTGCAEACVQGPAIEVAAAAKEEKAPEANTQPKTVKIKAVGVKFDPLIAYAEVGDTISWVNMAAHLVESIGEMSPADLTPFLSELSVDYSMMVEGEGIITYKCTPHWGARMGGFIVVGQPDNLDELVDQYLETASTTATLKAAKGLVKKLRKDLEKKGML